MNWVEPNFLKNALASVRRRGMDFARAEDGNFAMLFAFCSIALMGFVGAAIDYSSMTAAKSSLQSAADSAALAAVSHGAIIPNATAADQITNSTLVANRVFNSGRITNGAVVSTLNVNVTGSPGSYTATVAYKANYNLVFGAFVGLSSIAITGSATASSGQTSTSVPKYVDIYILADASGSMGIGATQGDIDAMNAGIGCSLGCHATGTDATARTLTNAISGKPVQLRFDVLKNSIVNIVNQAAAINATTPYIRIGIYSFATNFSTVIDLTADMNAVIAAANAMTLQGYDAGTNAATALSALQGKVATIGDGSSASQPLPFAILATDAVSNTTDNQSSSTWVMSPTLPNFLPSAVPDPVNNGVMELEGVDPNWCASLKSAGVRMMTLETQYLIAPVDLASNNLRYNYINQNLLSQTSTNMQACASDPSMAMSAMAPNAIQNAMSMLFAKATAMSPHLTQ
ncbi:MAG: VWA domain-containing protein [Hyphomicrobiales bacterium]|nr:VWA domain-containing protein [Hyphomicrobiales bacterium]MDE2115278.1 VWA domain-containing protein [Hyphomicrobiales bacterium]